MSRAARGMGAVAILAGVVFGLGGFGQGVLAAARADAGTDLGPALDGGVPRPDGGEAVVDDEEELIDHLELLEELDALEDLELLEALDEEG